MDISGRIAYRDTFVLIDIRRGSVDYIDNLESAAEYLRANIRYFYRDRWIKKARKRIFWFSNVVAPYKHEPIEALLNIIFIIPFLIIIVLASIYYLVIAPSVYIFNLIINFISRG